MHRHVRPMPSVRLRTPALGEDVVALDVCYLSAHMYTVYIYMISSLCLEGWSCSAFFVDYSRS